MTSCPSCKKHLRFAPGTEALQPVASPLRVEGSIRPPETGDAWEYAVIVTISNERGEEIARHLVNVGALQPGEARTFTCAVEVFTPSE